MNWTRGEKRQASKEVESGSEGGKPSRRAGKKRKTTRHNNIGGRTVDYLCQLRRFTSRTTAAVKKGGRQDDNALFPGKFLGRLFMLWSLRVKDNSSGLLLCHSLNSCDMLVFWGCAFLVLVHTGPCWDNTGITWSRQARERLLACCPPHFSGRRPSC